MIMRKNLVDQTQPFGVVHKANAFPSNVPIKPGVRNDLGANKVVGNNGFNHAPPILSNPNPGAGAYAGRFADNPFHFTGHPK